MNKKHWISVDFNSGLPLRIEQELIRHSYMQTAKGLTRKLRRELGLE